MHKFLRYFSTYPIHFLFFHIIFCDSEIDFFDSVFCFSDKPTSEEFFYHPCFEQNQVIKALQRSEMDANRQSIRECWSTFEIPLDSLDEILRGSFYMSFSMLFYSVIEPSSESEHK